MGMVHPRCLYIAVVLIKKACITIQRVSRMNLLPTPSKLFVTPIKFAFPAWSDLLGATQFPTIPTPNPKLRFLETKFDAVLKSLTIFRNSCIFQLNSHFFCYIFPPLPTISHSSLPTLNSRKCPTVPSNYCNIFYYA